MGLTSDQTRPLITSKMQKLVPQGTAVFGIQATDELRLQWHVLRHHTRQVSVWALTVWQ